MPQLKLVPSGEQEIYHPDYDFHAALNKHQQQLLPVSVETLQINITKFCNQSCVHCHVDSSPKRTEFMSRHDVERCLELLATHQQIAKLDITGGAPELHPDFDFLVVEARKLGKHVMARHNLTVTFDGNPKTGESKRYIPEFYAEHRVEVISSLPYYQQYFTDKQRGKGVFEKSIDAIRLLNENGYGDPATGLELNLVYNPVGAFLPADQQSLEAKFKQELFDKHGLVFNKLFSITNMPIHRFAKQLRRLGQYDEYMSKLVNAYNPAAAEGVMCRSLISIGYDGRIYDCDFNQMFGLQVLNGNSAMNIQNFNLEALLKRRIIFASHCFGCTAGAGSSCGGVTSG